MYDQHKIGKALFTLLFVITLVGLYIASYGGNATAALNSLF